MDFSDNRIFYEALQKRDSLAYDYLYKNLLRSFSHWVNSNNGSEMDAEDAFQKGLMNFLINIETGRFQYQENVKLTTVIFDYCKKVWLNELNSYRVKNSTQISDNPNFADNYNIQEDLEKAEIIKAVRLAVKRLKNDCQNVIEWFYIEELSLKEIAEKLGMKESSTKQKRFDCTEKLKALYINHTKSM